MKGQQTSYRQIFKATSIFGGVQFYQILLSIIRSKIVAVLLGPQGMGIVGLLLSATTLISNITGLGMSISAVRNISDANQKGDKNSIAFVTAVVKKLAFLTGLVGAILTLVLAPVLSKVTFGNTTYTCAFRALSLTFVLGSLSGAQSILLQGLRKLSYLAKSNMVASTGGLLISIPLYYFYKDQGIVPAMVLTSVVTASVAYYFGSKLNIGASVDVSFRQAIVEGKGMIRLGILLTLSTVIAGIASYFTRLFISRQGNLIDVGLYSAGFAIVNTYVGMIFTAISTDYYPRLAAVVSNRLIANKIVNQQSEMALLILGPILISFLIFLKYIIVILFTNEFLLIISMVQWFVVAMIFKSIAWATGYIFIARGDSKIFFWNELAANGYLFAFSLLGYYYLGLEGLGAAFFLSFVLSVIQNVTITKYLYQFSINQDLLLIFSVNALLVVSCFLIIRNTTDMLTWILVVPLGLISIIYSLWELNRRIDFRGYLTRLRIGK